MEIRQLKYFLKLAETLNFSEASRELYITQSTLSQQILNLERELNQQLFMRNSHELDFVLAFKPTEHNERIESQVLFNNRLTAIVNNRHSHRCARQRYGGLYSHPEERLPENLCEGVHPSARPEHGDTQKLHAEGDVDRRNPIQTKSARRRHPSSS